MLPGMAESLTVSITDLRSALSRALDAVETRLGPDVALTADHYWHLPVQDAFDLASEPATFTVGQLRDDVETLREPSDATSDTAWHDLSHLVGVLRALELAARP